MWWYVGVIGLSVVGILFTLLLGFWLWAWNLSVAGRPCHLDPEATYCVVCHGFAGNDEVAVTLKDEKGGIFCVLIPGPAWEIKTSEYVKIEQEYIGRGVYEWILAPIKYE